MNSYQGSASGCLGEVLSKTDAEVAHFLVTLSCEEIATAPTLGISSLLDMRGEGFFTNKVNIGNVIIGYLDEC